MNKYLKYGEVVNANEDVQSWIKRNLTNYLKENSENQDEIEHIIDYLVSEDAPERMSKMSYPEALSNSKKWTKAQQKKGVDIQELAEDTEVVLKLKDGFNIVKLLGENAYKREGFLMSQCVGSYYGNGKEIYSLRDKDNMPHCTMEAGQQVKGKGNGSIHPKYVEHVVKFLEFTGMTVGENEMKNLGYMNVERIKKDLSKDTKFFNKVYVPEDEELLGKDGKAYYSLDLLAIKPLIKETDTSLKINFNLPAFISGSIEFLQKTTKKILSGHASKLATSGNSSKLATSGDYSKLATSGDYSQLEINGKKSVGANIGYKGKIKGVVGTWITLAEYDDEGVIAFVKSAQIDGKKLKENTWYTLKDKKFVVIKT